jgi:L-alanine-DL-glutamate epimerase-like enolase superfamily enzyme
VDILVEVHRRLAPANAIRVARMMEPYAPFWFEEPVSVRDLGGLLEAKRAITLPVVTGEEIYTKTEFHEVITRRAADILNPDVCNCGGILELREIAAMAEPHHIAISPHNYNSTTVGLAATLQAAAGMPNFLITEYFVNEASARDRPAAFQVEDSMIAATAPDRRPRRTRFRTPQNARHAPPAIPLTSNPAVDAGEADHRRSRGRRRSPAAHLPPGPGAVAAATWAGSRPPSG